MSYGTSTRCPSVVRSSRARGLGCFGIQRGSSLFAQRYRERFRRDRRAVDTGPVPRYVNATHRFLRSVECARIGIDHPGNPRGVRYFSDEEAEIGVQPHSAGGGRRVQRLARAGVASLGVRERRRVDQIRVLAAEAIEVAATLIGTAPTDF